MRNLTVRLTALAAFLSLAACAQKPLEIPAGQPTFYLSMASRDAKVDTVAARDLISIYRRNNGLSTVALDPLLLAEAQKQADAMAAANSMSHEVRASLQVRLDGSGLGHTTAVENISAGYHTLADAISGWRNSRPHNENLLNGKMRRMGIASAYAPGTKYKVFWALVMSD
jgi:uncharacterized protein YkwD